MRVYLAIVDETEEAKLALRFAARRASDTGGSVHILALVPRQQFSAFGGIQATIEEEARIHAEAIVAGAAGTLLAESGVTPSIVVRQGDGPKIVREMIAAKQKGGKDVVEVEAPDDTNVIDLMAALRNSLKGSATGKKPAAKAAPAKKKAAAKKAPAKKSAKK